MDHFKVAHVSSLLGLETITIQLFENSGLSFPLAQFQNFDFL